MDDLDVERLRADIPYIHDKIYVDSASVTPVPFSVQDASRNYDRILSTDLKNYRAATMPYFDKGRSLAAKLVGTSPEKIAFIQNTAHGLSLVALGIDWRQGDNIVICAEDFPSNYLCWLQLAERGVEVRQVPSVDGRVETQQVISTIDSRTRVVAVSHVQFYSGFRVDVAALGQACHTSGALLVVDGTQSTGVIDLDVTVAGVDVLVASAHKWMMGPRGIGIAVFSERALSSVTPRIVGWLSVNEPFAFNRQLDFLPDARRFEPGTANGSGILGLAERLSQIDSFGIAHIESRVIGLGQHLRDRARSAGMHLVFDFPAAASSGITMFKKPNVPTTELHSTLARHKIYTSVRNDAIRIATHYFNTFNEIDAIIEVLSEA